MDDKTEKGIFVSGFIAGMERALSLRDPKNHGPAPNMSEAFALFRESGGLSAFLSRYPVPEGQMAEQDPIGLGEVSAEIRKPEGHPHG